MIENSGWDSGGKNEAVGEGRGEYEGCRSHKRAQAETRQSVSVFGQMNLPLILFDRTNQSRKMLLNGSFMDPLDQRVPMIRWGLWTVSKTNAPPSPDYASREMARTFRGGKADPFNFYLLQFHQSWSLRWISSCLSKLSSKKPLAWSEAWSELLGDANRACREGWST